MTGFARRGLIALCILQSLTLRATASESDFYKGKSIRLLISAPAGSGYDAYARLMARHFGKQLPGTPDVVPQNMPGAGGATLLNTVYNKGPFDGTAIFTLHFTLPLYQAIGGQGVRFDILKLRGIGRLLASNTVIGVAADSKSGVRTFEDALTKEAIIGTTGATSNSTLFPSILNKMVGTKFKLVAGYEGAGAVFLAMQRGEIDGFGSYSYLTFKSVHPDYLTKKLFHPIVQWGEQREQAWPDVPTAIDVAKTPIDKGAMQLVSAGSDIGFSYFMPPGVPDERAKNLQRAFDEMIKSPAFLSDAERSKLELRTATAKDIEGIVKKVLSASPEVIKRVVELNKL